MARRTGLRSIRDLAQKMCIFIARFSAIIKTVYPDNTALHVALEAALAACAVLVETADESLPVGD